MAEPSSRVRSERPAFRGRTSALLIAAFVLAGLLLLVTSVPLWLRLLALGLATGALLAHARNLRLAMDVGWEVDDAGVRRLQGGQAAVDLPWSELIAVSIIKSAEPGWGDDYFYVLSGVHGTQLVVPLERAATSDLLTRLGRLPGFDHQAVVEATRAAGEVEISCWTGEPGEGEAAGS